MSTSAPLPADQRFLDDIYGRIARRYDLLNHVQSFGLATFVRRTAARIIAAGVVLDVGAGSGDLARACLRAGARRVICLDRNEGMFREARRKLRDQRTAGKVFFVIGDVRRLPFKDGVFDGAGSAFVFRNLPAEPGMLGEIGRTLRRGAPVAVVDMFAPPGGLWGLLYRVYLKVGFPFWGRIVVGHAPAYSYLKTSVLKCFTAESFAGRLRDAGFIRVGIKPCLGGVTPVVTGRRA